MERVSRASPDFGRWNLEERNDNLPSQENQILEEGLPFESEVVPLDNVVLPSGNGSGSQDRIPTGDELEVANMQEHVDHGYYIVEDILKHKFRSGYYFLTKWEGFPMSDCTWEPIKQFILPDGSINPLLHSYCQEKRLHTAWEKASALSDRQKCMNLPNTISL